MALSYSHFKGAHVTRAELVERVVVERILASGEQIPDKQRVWGKVFELKHSSGVIQIGRLLAEKRGLNSELAGLACVLHDIYVNDTGQGKDHAQLGSVIAAKILRDTGKFTDEEIALITQAVKNHSDKHIISTNPYDELVKDADVLECSLYENIKAGYLEEKPVETCRIYFERIKKVRREMGLPDKGQWEI